MVTHQIRKKSVLIALLGLLAFLSHEWSVLVPTANAIRIRSKIQLLVQRVSRAWISQVERLWKYLPRSRLSTRWRFGSADARNYYHGLCRFRSEQQSDIKRRASNGRQRHHHRCLRVHRLGYFELRDDSSEHRLRRGVHPWTRKRRLRYGGQRQRFGKCLCTLDALGAIPRNEG